MESPTESRLRAVVEARLDAVPWVHRSGPYQGLDLRFGVRTCDPALGEYLASAFASLAVDGPLDEVSWFSALERQRSARAEHVGYLGGRRLVASAAPRQVLAFILWALNQEVVASARGTVLIHAGAVERDGVVVVLPASQESGKTTLVTGLLRRGYRYVTDEAFALDIASGRIRPFPKALSLDAGSWALFPELRPTIPPSQAPYVADQWHIPPSALGAAVAGVDATPGVVLSPGFQLGAETVLTRLRPAEGLFLLVQNSFNGADWGQAGLDAAAEMIRGCAVLGTLTGGDLESACDAVDRAVDEAVATRPGGQGA